jgi:hypothetical protein
MSTIFTQTMTSEQVSSNVSFRSLCAVTGASQGQVRVTFQAGTGSNMVTDHCSVGVSVGGGNPQNTAATPVELTFSGGHGFNISPNTTIVSDWVNLSFGGTATLVVTLDRVASSDFARAGLVNGVYFGTPPAYNVATTSGFSSANVLIGVTLIETQAGATASSILSLATAKRVFLRPKRIFTPR